jgi:hypothetical protein
VIHNLLIGAVALLFAAAEALFAVAMGTRLARTVVDPILRLSAALVVGSGISAMLLASISWAVSVNAALVTDVVVGVIALVLEWREVTRVLGDGRATIAALARESRLAGSALVVAFSFYWLNAIAPPRDGDVVRYHLAHIAQIVRDGKWMPIADYHYALPFGWTFNYLPFQAANIPQAAHMLNAIVVLLIALTLMSFAKGSRHPSTVRAAAVAFVLHPAVLKAGTTAFADAYSMLVVLTAAVLISRHRDEPDSRSIAFLAGFVSWIGIQSRYQLIAFGIAATLAFLWGQGRGQRKSELLRFALGAAIALVVASPFYLMNLHEFGNPVWPFFAGRGLHPSYADVIAQAYQRSQTGAHSIIELSRGLRRLIEARDMFPIPIFVGLAVAVGWLRRRAVSIPLLVVATSFIALWIVAQPALFPRFVLYFFPLGLLIALELIGNATATAARVSTVGLVVAALTLAVADVAYATDNLEYVSSGDRNTFHRYTWYYPVYQWINTRMPPDARFAVIVWSGYSYYLDRQYRRADPWLSGEVDWDRIGGAQALDSVLARRNIDYVVYENRDWTAFHGGARMTRVIGESVRKGTLVPLHKFHERLYTSRLNRAYLESDVYVLKRN